MRNPGCPTNSHSAIAVTPGPQLPTCAIDSVGGFIARRAHDRRRVFQRPGAPRDASHPIPAVERPGICLSYPRAVLLRPSIPATDSRRPDHHKSPRLKAHLFAQHALAPGAFEHQRLHFRVNYLVRPVVDRPPTCSMRRTGSTPTQQSAAQSDKRSTIAASAGSIVRWRACSPVRYLETTASSYR
jgi:hypothetical protein